MGDNGGWNREWNGEEVLEIGWDRREWWKVGRSGVKWA